MTRNKILILLVVALLATNVAMLLYFLNRPGHKGRRFGREAALTDFVQKEMGFGPRQLQQYDSLAKLHREKIKALMDSLRTAKEQELKKVAAAGFSDSAMAQTATQSASGQTAMELLMLQHFKQVRSLCTPAQQARFDTGFYKLWHRKQEAGAKDKKR
jgi:periplasmic protein CpxP/Spy